MFIQVCLNGSRQPGEHPALPLTPEQLAIDAYSVIEAGGSSLHIHPRDFNGCQTLASDDIGEAIVAIRSLCPGIAVGVSTAAWIEPNVERRLQLVQAWKILPDFASVNFSEPATAKLCAILFEYGIGVEAGLATVQDVQLLLTLDIANRCKRLLIEPVAEEINDALIAVREIENLLNEAHIQTPRLLHGEGSTTWPLLKTAFDRGYESRIGLEDSLNLSDGCQAGSNTDLIVCAYKLLNIKI